MIRSNAFDSLADLYDLLTDWDRRLPREIGYLVRVLQEDGRKRLLDAACGTGAHLVALEEAGFDVAGADLSPRMIERTRLRLGEGVTLAVARFADLPAHLAPREAVLVLGNSLPAAGSEEAVRDSLAGLAASVLPGGLLILHSLNFTALLAGGGGLRPAREVREGPRRHLFLKLFEVEPPRVVLHVIAVSWEAERLSQQHFRSDLWPVELPWLESELNSLGLTVERATGGFDDTAFDAETSGDLLVIARKARGDA
jgi:SAM-dependent methyltransferase